MNSVSKAIKYQERHTQLVFILREGLARCYTEDTKKVLNYWAYTASRVYP